MYLYNIYVCIYVCLYVCILCYEFRLFLPSIYEYVPTLIVRPLLSAPGPIGKRYLSTAQINYEAIERYERHL